VPTVRVRISVQFHVLDIGKRPGSGGSSWSSERE